jgi:hypothetical protein
MLPGVMRLLRYGGKGVGEDHLKRAKEQNADHSGRAV